jgi:NAD(P)-dependent dehydrogenase (short-subunit alcohol dehydrogenase family)
MLRELLTHQSGVADLTPDQLAAHFLTMFRPRIYVQLPGTSAEVAAAVVFFASEVSSFLNGTTLRVDGGSVGVVGV